MIVDTLNGNLMYFNKNFLYNIYKKNKVNE